MQPPVPAEPLSYVLNASQFARKCPQANTDKELVELMTSTGDIEDCLHLNVYTTQLPGKCNTLHPVMFYIHGGSFRVGSSHDYRPDYLLEKDIVLVVIQYRLGPLGFLSLQNEDISGNMGLLDQLLALKWVNKHIVHFCGNPKQVTIFGQSSGAGAVSLMLASPMTRDADLFHRAIIQSGSGLCDWALDDHPERHAKIIASLAKCPNSTDEEITTCLRKLTPYQLFIAHADYLVGVLLTEGRAVGGNNGGNHAIVQTVGANKFLVEDPKVSYANGNFLKIPMMIGVTKHEGTFFVGNIYDFILDRLNATNNTDFLTSTFLQAVLKFSGIVDPTGAITDIFETKFFQTEEVGNFTAMIPGLIDICGDTLIKSCTFKTARFNYDQVTYLYSFNYKGHLTKFGHGEEVNYPFSGGVAHSDDLIYLFPHGNGTLNEDEKIIARTMVELWTNFAIYGDPTPALGVEYWPPMSTYYGPYLRIDKESSVETNFLSEYYVTINEGLNSLEPEINGSNLESPKQFFYIFLLFVIYFVMLT
ncbi:hypothetical protein AAG570_001397 [Ranatra chinensis]|uniref:Carboxylesterase type B domain-containing protein n=1 Tax=Ranatra chinensis TaxID=642074 RepID=A0ABD0YC17_9HEMI